MCSSKIGRPVFPVKKSYQLIDHAALRGGTISLILRRRRCQAISEIAYAVVGTRELLLLTSAAINPLPAADRNGNFTVLARHPRAWVSDLERAKRTYARLVRRGIVPRPEAIRRRRRAWTKRH